MAVYVINQAVMWEEREKVCALFAEHGYEGRGNFCGWYSYECYTNARIVAMCEGERISENVKMCNQTFDEVEIWSAIVEHKFEADNDEEAVKKFKELLDSHNLRYSY